MKEKIIKLRKNTSGQVLLLATVSIIFILLSGATLLNVSGFTAYQEEKSIDTTNDAFDQLIDTEYAIETSMNHVNHGTSSGDYSNKEAQINSDITVIENRFSRLFKTEGGSVSIETNNDFTRGVRVWRPRYGNLSRNDGAETYMIVNNNADARAFTITNNGQQNGIMRVNMGNQPNVEIETNSNQVTVRGGGETCTRDATLENPAKISFTQGEINGINCEALPKSDDIGTIQLQNTDNIEGALNLVIDNRGTPLGISQSASSDPESVEAHEAIYSTDVYITSVTPKTTLRTEVEVAPQLSIEAKQ